MKKEEAAYHKFDSLSDVHRAFGLPMPVHPLISFIDNSANQIEVDKLPQSHVLNFYKISYRIKQSGKLKYGQSYYDFDEGSLMFASPGQLIGRYKDSGESLGYTLLVHPDFFQTYPLAKKIRQYGFFAYSANEALHLSDNEKTTLMSIFKIIETELNSRIDDFSQDVIVSQIEVLLNYANRFYKRQFITRKAVNNDLLEKLEEVLEEYFSSEKPLSKGIPTVQYLSEHLNISPSYLSDMLRSLTGQNAQQHIHHKLIEMAKEKLSTTTLSISEVAYVLGFEHSSSFNRLFKSKTNVTPLEFRASFS
ncbi:AraC family transcriptional regulator [Pedobacter sp. L105]|uniref:helix-turn-helix domain-containing protein n=1 Tax=Pedobacter sp. L105 TaxID=1641871 RepID=UPI00131BF14E|nr:helix-turn-helix transcriptional regulator [Pedobacter sp. L105]